jgi:hypothetical protein
VIPSEALGLMRADVKVAERLVCAGLWDQESDGYRIHDWDDYQSVSAKRSEAGRKGGEKSGQVRTGKQNEQTNKAKVLLPEAKKFASSKQAQPNPTQPDPTDVARRTARPRNELWDALTEVCGWDGKLTKSQQGRVATSAKELSEIGASPDEVRRRASHYKAKYPGMDVTPTALSANWASIAQPPSGPGRVTGVGTGGVFFND